jgi:hypothetical protein
VRLLVNRRAARKNSDSLSVHRTECLGPFSESIKKSQHFCFSRSAIPSFFLYKNGNKISDISGALPGPQLEAWIDASLLGA